MTEKTRRKAALKRKTSDGNKSKNSRNRFGRELLNWVYIILGLGLCTLGYNLFLIPNNIAAGGFTGAAQLINAATGWQVGLMVLCMNIPLFAFSVKSMGLAYGLKSLIATVLFSAFIDLFPLSPAAEDAWLATIYGGLLTGLGFGFVMRGNATTGGSDMLANLIHRLIPQIPIGTAMSIFDGVVILVSVFVFDTKLALYALITMIICNFVVNFVLEGPNAAHAFFIISDRNDEISSRIMIELERGATEWIGRGMYSGEEKSVLLCAVSLRETITLRRIVHSVDPNAFVISTRAHETYGEGFKIL